ncbi:uncharacterized protein LOC129219833 [Uloborus diversus]|uniref:uncharacterized protein LOC129219833 n=1 Tax=Uloborus diversus TaxID=327109 RepID=UPI00240A3A6D|nr:uncharacterized protein LOC129219833 [Uloborus diversus]
MASKESANKRQAKVAAGVQTDEVRRRCWRHRRSSTAISQENLEITSMDTSLLNETDSNCGTLSSNATSDTLQSNVSPRSTLRSALPSVNFPKWSRTSKKPNAVSVLTERYLSALYRPFASVRKQLTEQALSRCQLVGQEHFEAHYLGPTALFLRTVRDCQGSFPSFGLRKHRTGRSRKKKCPTGWPLCTRGSVLVHLCDPDPSLLKAGDFYFVATPVGVALKWTERGDSSVRERCLDAREFSHEMAALVTSQSSEDDEDAAAKSNLLVAEEQGIRRLEVSHLMEELTAGGRRRGRLYNTRDSWVQTEKDLAKSSCQSPVESKAAEVPHPLAPLASEEEFCSDSEQKQRSVQSSDSVVEEEILTIERRSPLPEVQQPNAIADINPDVMCSQVAIMPGCRDVCGRSVVYISLEKIQSHKITAAQLAEILLYYQSIPK